MATLEMPKKRHSKAKRRSTPISTDRIIDRTEDVETETNVSQQTPPKLQLESNDYHILDLLLNESFADIDFFSEKPDTPLAEAFGEEHSNASNVVTATTVDTDVIADDKDLGLDKPIVQNMKDDDDDNDDVYNRQQDLTTHMEVTDERPPIWSDIDYLSDIVSRLYYEQPMSDPPPRYSYNFDEKNLPAQNDLPKYSSPTLLNLNLAVNEKTQRDLEYVISAIQRIYTLAPQLNNQRVELSNRQRKDIMAATISTAIGKLSKGRYEEQRAEFSSVIKYQTLNKLVEQISKSHERSFSDQRVELNSRQIRNLEIARLDGMIERLEKNRMNDQDWYPPEQLFVKDLTNLTNELSKSATNSMFASQRFHLTPTKEKNMFMNSVFKKVEKLHSYRMINQDANSPYERWEREAEQIISKMQSNPSMDSQRATWSPKN